MKLNLRRWRDRQAQHLVDLRAITMLKRFIDSGGQLTEAAKIAGPARLDTTKRYVQPGWGDLEAAVENL